MENINVSGDDGLQEIVGSFDSLDAIRAEELDTTNRLQAITNTAGIQERARLAAKYGEDHPRVKNLDARLSYNVNMLKGLATAIERNNIKVPVLPVNSWRVQGRVFDSNDAPLKGLTVFLSNSNKQAIGGLDYTCTDEQGYYAITLGEREISDLKDETVFLAVSDANRRVVYVSSDALSISIRAVSYQDVFIEQSGCDVAPPPDSNAS
jgi:hypothetical protein